MRHKCRMAAIETEANTNISKSLMDDRDPCEEVTCLEILGTTGQQGLVCIKHKVSGWDQIGSSE